MALHPDRHEGCETKAGEFKKATEAYTVLSDISSRKAHDQALHGYSNSSTRTTSRPPPNYRKVYAPRPPPGFKVFNAKKHFDMHYGDGMMEEEIERARKRVEKATGKVGGSYDDYQSPLGEGFDMRGGRNFGGNPYSKTGRSIRSNPKASNGAGGGGAGAKVEFEYEEGYMDMNQSQYFSAKRERKGREMVAERMKERRKYRRRNRGDPQRYDGQEGCVIS
eukprot:CAMPEP_0204623608 /NCGR_PEP_ID=MMETSP0717-20131115/9335_1 /ASSEMBLY_ACC=CAM_ASM_000666 /TAXON_ID=230516 /ORGANISM="Chaetoceros curvisetus" /LENGTH=220 /DNA_ID=CAMNT_0051638731 /DNA_START=128 /DNA_END=790 /DNA_ORIENTATION=-